MKGPLFVCVIFHTSENHVPEGMNPLLLSMSVEREIKQRLMDQWNCREFIYMGNTLLILELDAEDKITQITDACDRFCRWAYRIMGCSCLQRESEPCVTACMRSVFPMNGQEKQFLTGFYTEQNGAINIGEIVPKEQIKPVQSEESRMQMLFRAIRIGDSAEIERAAHGEMEKLHKKYRNHESV